MTFFDGDCTTCKLKDTKRCFHEGCQYHEAQAKVSIAIEKGELKREDFV